MGVNLKLVSLLVLVFQNSFLILTLRYSKTLPEKYISSTAVVCAECLKFLTSLFIHIYQCCRDSTAPNKISIKKLLNDFFGKGSDCFKIMIPAVLYLIQNNLQYLAASKLDAATFQVTYQMKIITTAIFSVIILNRKLFKHQWIAITLLFIGIVLVQFPTGDMGSANSENAFVDKLIGLLAIVIACILSGVAGVYFEKILKKSNVTLWVRNVQLSLFSIIPGYFIGVLVLDKEAYQEKGFFGGYSQWTVLAILLQAFGGILIAVVVKYADNILKGFATSISIILSCAISYFIFSFNITYIFVVGSLLVIYATYLYGKKPKQQTTNENDTVVYSKFEEGNYSPTEENDYLLSKLEKNDNSLDKDMKKSEE